MILVKSESVGSVVLSVLFTFFINMFPGGSFLKEAQRMVVGWFSQNRVVYMEQVCFMGLGMTLFLWLALSPGVDIMDD